MKALYRSMNEQIRPMVELNEQVMAKITAKPNRILRPAVAMATVLVLLIAAMPTMAKNVPLVHDALNMVAPELADRLVPVQLSAEDKGVRMEVVAASVHDNVAEWVIRIEGDALAGWKTIGPVISVKDHCGIFGMTTRTDGESLDDYDGMAEDREKGIWYYVYRKTYPEGCSAEEILGDKMTLRLAGVELGDAGFYGQGGEAVPVIFTDYELMTVVYDRALYDYGFSHFGKGGHKEHLNRAEYTLMTPGESVYNVTDQLSLTGAAYIDGKLHIQLAAVDQIVNNTPEWGYWRPYFVDAAGNQIKELYHTNFGIEAEGHETDYTECVYDIPQEELENYTMILGLMNFDFLSCHCSVTFEVGDVLTDPA